MLLRSDRKATLITVAAVTKLDSHQIKGSVTGYRLPGAIDEAAEQFGRERIPSAEYTCNGKRIVFIDTTHELFTDKRVDATTLGKTKIPGVYYLADCPELNSLARTIQIPEPERITHADPAA